MLDPEKSDRDRLKQTALLGSVNILSNETWEKRKAFTENQENGQSNS